MKLKSLKTVLMVTLVVMVGVFMQGCGSKDYDEEVVNGDEEYEEEYDEEEEEGEAEGEEEAEAEGEEEAGDYVRFGSYETGFLNLPSDWILMNSVNPNASETQYCNQEQTFMVRLMAADDDGVGAEATSEDYSNAMQAQGESQTGKGEILGIDAYQSFTELDDGTDELVWFFQAEEDVMQMILIQGLHGEMQFLMDLVNDTFSFEE